MGYFKKLGSLGGRNYRQINKQKYADIGQRQMMELTGDVELKRAILYMKNSSARRMMLPAIKAALVPANKEAKNLVPYRTGQLQKAIAIGGGKYKEGVRGYLMVRSGFDHEIKGKSVDPAKYAWYVEYGKGGKDSFLRRAIDNKRAAIKTILTSKAKERLKIVTAEARRRGKTL